MRIVYIHQYFNTPDMPGGTRSFELASRLVRRGHEVHVVTAEDAAPPSYMSWRHSSEHGVHVHWLSTAKASSPSYRRRLFAFFQFAVLATLQAMKLRPEVVLATSTPLTVAIPGVLAARFHRARFVFEVRDLWPEMPIEVGALRNPMAVRFAFALARWAYRNASRVIALSPGMAAGVEVQGYPRERITVVPNACDLDTFRKVDAEEVRAFRSSRPWLGQRPLIVYAGTVNFLNGVDYLVRLAAQVADQDPDIRFLILGDGTDQSRVERLAAELGVLGKSVFFEPSVPKSQMPTVLAATTMATSLFKPFDGMRVNSANKFFDALAASRPVAINYGGWHADLLGETGAGVVLDPHDIDPAAQDLRRLVRNEAWLASAAQASHRLAERFSRDRLFRQFADALLCRSDTLKPPPIRLAPARGASRNICRLVDPGPVR